MTPVLFVSHSSADRELAGRVVRLLEERAKCLPVMDQDDLREGTEWRPQLYQWMAKCQAALLLLTESAIESNWVLQEATILRARKVLEPGFRVFVVASPELRSRKPERWKLFEPLDLDELQGVRTMDPWLIASTISDEMARDQGGTTYFDLLAKLLEDNLTAFEGKSNTLEAIGEAMRLADARWTRIVGGDEGVVQLIARRLCRGDLREYQDLRDFLQTLTGVGVAPEALTALLNSIAPYWVDIAAAACLPAAAAAAPPRLVAMRASELQDFTAARYIARHYLVYRQVPVVLTLGGGNEQAGADDLRSQLLDAVRAYNRGYRKMSDPELAAVLRRPAPTVRPEFVLLPEQHAEDEAFELANEFHRYVFIVPVRDAAVPRQTWRRCRWVEPELSAEDESNRFIEFEDASALVR